MMTTVVGLGRWARVLSERKNYEPDSESFEIFNPMRPREKDQLVFRDRRFFPLKVYLHANYAIGSR